jgi:hypothetical protein
MPVTVRKAATIKMSMPIISASILTAVPSTLWPWQPLVHQPERVRMGMPTRSAVRLVMRS